MCWHSRLQTQKSPVEKKNPSPFAAQNATSSSTIQASGEKFLVVFFVILTVFGLPHASSTIRCSYILTAHLSRVPLTQSRSLLPLPKTSQWSDYLSILLMCRTRKQVSVSGGVFLWLCLLSSTALALLSAWLHICSQCQILHLQVRIIYPKYIPISISLLIRALKCGYQTLVTGTL